MRFVTGDRGLPAIAGGDPVGLPRVVGVMPLSRRLRITDPAALSAHYVLLQIHGARPESKLISQLTHPGYLHRATLTPGPIPIGDPQGRDVTVVDLVQSGSALLLLGVDLGDVFGSGAALIFDDLAVARIAAQPRWAHLSTKLRSVICDRPRSTAPRSSIYPHRRRVPGARGFG